MIDASPVAWTRVQGWTYDQMSATDERRLFESTCDTSHAGGSQHKLVREEGAEGWPRRVMEICAAFQLLWPAWCRDCQAQYACIPEV